MGRFRYEFSNLCGSAHRGANLLFSPDGKLLYSAVGGRVTAFDLVAARSRTLPFECRTDIATMCLSPDGTMLLVVDLDGRALLINVESRTVFQRFSVHGQVAKNAANFSPCQKYFAIGVGRRLEIWRVPESRVPEFAPFRRSASLTHHRDNIVCLAWSKTSSHIVTGSRDLTAKVYFVKFLLSGGPRPENRRVVPLTIFGHKDHAIFVSFIGDGEPYGLITVARDGSLYCWGLRTNPELKALPENGIQEADEETRSERTEAMDDASDEDHGEVVEDDDPDGGPSDENSENGQLKLISADVRLSSKHNLKEGGARRVSSTALDVTTGLLSVGMNNGVFALYELPIEMRRRDPVYEEALFDRPRTTAPYSELNMLHSLTISTNPVTSMAVNETGEWIALGVASLGQLVVWEWRSETHILKQQGHLVGGSSIAFSADGRAIASGGDDGRVKLWAVHSGFCVATFNEHDAGVTAVTFATRDVVLSASLDGTVRAYDVRRYRCFRVLVGPPPRRQFSSVTADSAGEVVAAGCRDSFEVVVWSLRTGRVLDVVSGHTGPVSSLSFHPTRGQLATGSWDASVRIWEIYSDTASEVLKHDKEVLCVAYRPDGAELAVATRNGEITLWDPESARVKGSIDGGRDAAPGRLRDQRTVAARKGFFTSICYSADGRFLLAGGEFNAICAYSVIENRDPVLFHTYPVSVNETLDGVLQKLSTRKLTDSGAPDEALEVLDEEADDYEVQKRKVEGSLPGESTEIEKRRAGAKCVAFSPTGSSWAAMTSEGLAIYSFDLEWTSEFDPLALDVDVTEEAARKAASKGDFVLALQIAARLGDLNLLSSVVNRIPVASFPTVLQHVPLQHFQRLCEMVVKRLDTKAHLGFDMELSRFLLLELGYRDSPGSTTLATSLRALYRAASTHWERLSRVCESNSHRMDFILAQAELTSETEAAAQ